MASRDLSDPAQWHCWTGNAMTGDGSGVPPLPCLRNDGSGSYQRHVTHRTFSAPVTFVGWFEWLSNGGTEPYHGIHVGLTQDNDYGYHLSLRADGTVRLLSEQRGYSELTKAKPAPGRPGDGARHQFTFTVTHDRVSGSFDGVEVVEDDGAHHRHPRIRSGRLGLRLDRQLVRLGSLVALEA